MEGEVTMESTASESEMMNPAVADTDSQELITGESPVLGNMKQTF